VGLVVDRAQPGLRRQRLAERLDAGRESDGEPHGVGVALLVDRELDRFTAVDARDRLAILVTVADGRHVAQINRPAVAGGEDRVRHLLDGLELVQRPDQEALGTLLEAATGQVDVLLPEAPGDGVNSKADLRQPLLVDQHLDLVLIAAADLDRGRARDRLEVGFQPVLGEAPQALETLFAGRRLGNIEQREPHDRLTRRVEAQQQRPLRLER
jgi:hypothetical protein